MSPIFLPLVVDLDGTLIHTDMLHESALKVLREQPLAAVCIPLWLIRGKAVLKQNLAKRAEFRPDTLPYNQELLAWLQQQKKAGRSLILCTASDLAIADAVASHLGLFDEVMASDGARNLSGAQKAEALNVRFGQNAYVYAGDSHKDLPVWRNAAAAVLVNAGPALTEKARRICKIEKQFPPGSSAWHNWLQAIRMHQWLKNLLLFVPLAAAHQLHDGAAWQALILAFMAFSLCASAVYITNDLFDLESDRLHPRKLSRPFASGTLPAWQGVLLTPVLLSFSLILALLVGTAFVLWLTVYFVLTCAYSFGLKRLMLVDCLTLAILYTLRIVAGAAAAQVELSFWLLTESLFLFLSLAFVKRYAELSLQSDSGKTQVHGRSYRIEDAPLIRTLGVTSAYVAVLVLALYLNSNAVLVLYPNRVIAWAAVPCMLFWVNWMWLQANRGNMHDDPLVYAVKDKVSLLAGCGFGLALTLGSLEWQW
jgi:4-hydroxybenzoate polyprenyltransferase/phosphoserine phosphatase